jgi:hypothetical protein
MISTASMAAASYPISRSWPS